MPHQTPLLPGDPRGVGRYRVAGRLAGIPSDDPIFVGTGPDGSEVAISILGGDWSRDAAARDRFAAEATVAKRVPPFCAARVLDAGLDGAEAYLVSEYVPGPSLLELVGQEGLRRGHDLDAIAIGMATGLASVHQAGLVHGSFGPAYVIMSTADGSLRVVEFGITPPYGTATPSADMFAWAQTVVFAAAGRPPATVADLDVLPDHLRVLAEHCLNPDPSERPAARAVVHSLLGGGAVTAGVLAEGSRRAARPVSRPAASYDDPALAARHPRTGAYQPRPPGPGPARPPGSSGQFRSPPPRPGPGHQPYDGLPAGSGRSHGSGPHSARSGNGRRTGLIAAAAVVVIVLIAVVAVRLMGGSKSDDGRLASDSGSTATSAPPRSSPASPTPGPSAPAGFAGHWSGQVQQPPTDTYDVSVVFKAGASTGKISYTGTGLNCSGQLTVVTATNQKLTASQGIIQGQSTCENGDVTLILSSAGDSIKFTFHSAGPTAAGTLTRS